MIGIERVDFFLVPVRDLARAEEFYGKTLGLERNPNSSERWVEYETGNVTLALISPAVMGPGFLDDFRPIWMPIALRVPDVAEARRRLEAAGVEFRGEIIDSGVCHLANFADPDVNALPAPPPLRALRRRPDAVALPDSVRTYVRTE
jgi:catechol 2,3-dioxygenase-like lactoylglutathione lyase family enzyme